MLVVSQARKALIVEHPAGPPASLTQLLTQLEPGIDLVLVEGYADQPCARVLIHRQGWPLPEPFAQASVLALLSDAQPLPQLGYAPSLALGDIPSLEQTDRGRFYLHPHPQGELHCGGHPCGPDHGL